jgi:hypothetical protein
VFHLNEGMPGSSSPAHPAGMIDDGLTFEEAKAAVRPGAVFTTHTLVPAGIDRFTRAHEKFSPTGAPTSGSPSTTLGSATSPTPSGVAFNMAAPASASPARATARRPHGEVSREMFAGIWPDLPPDEVPIASVTNGVHARTWTTPEMASLYQRILGDDWPEAPAEEPVLGRRSPHPCHRVPARLDQELRLDPRGQRGDLPDKRDADQHMRKLHPRGICRASCDGRGIERGHRSAPACSRGLGTASTAARSRDGSGCR